MLSWLYDILVSIATFIIGLFGCDMKKKEVTFSDEVKVNDKEDDKEELKQEEKTIEDSPIETQ